jgi:hypothetical protein
LVITQPLHTITNRLLDASAADYKELFNAADDLYTLLVNISGLDTEGEVYRDDNKLQSGKAIGAAWAALCIKDLLRTKKFMDGLYHAVRLVQQNKPGHKTHIIYAGTGPFATLLLPLIARFGPDEIECTLMEVNEPTLALLQRTIDTFGLQPYIRSLVCADAVTYTLPAGTRADILLSETMQMALKKEPQVAIFSNLIHQLNDDCLIIPEKITIEAALVHEGRRSRMRQGEKIEKEKVIYPLGKVFELTKQLLHDHPLPKPPAEYIFPAKQIELSAHIIHEFPFLHLMTRIQVFDNDILEWEECTLTGSLRLVHFTEQDNTPASVSFHYATGAVPGIRYSLCQEPRHHKEA